MLHIGSYWWNLNILEVSLRGEETANPVFFISGRTIRAYAILALKVLGWRPRIAAAPSFPSIPQRVFGKGSEEFGFALLRPGSSHRMKAGRMEAPVYPQLKHRPGAQDHARFNDAFQLPDVSGPRIR